MSTQTLAIEDDWIQAVRARIGELPGNVEDWDIEQLRDRLTSVAWLSDRPSASAIPANSLNRQLRRHQFVIDDDKRFTALLIAWPPGHRTPLHSHNGLWGIELVIDGALAIEEFDKGTSDHEDILAHERTLILGIGDAAAFSGDSYVHSCRNLSAQQVALSLHIYGGVLDEFSTFQTSAFGQYTESRQTAIVDAVLS